MQVSLSRKIVYQSLEVYAVSYFAATVQFLKVCIKKFLKNEYE